MFLLSGFLSDLTGSPGVLQSMRLDALNTFKQDQLKQIEAEISSLEAQELALTKDPRTIEAEIRESLGYVAADELVMTFAD